MDGDPSQEDRIRLIGRLFLNLKSIMLNKALFEHDAFVNFCGKLLRNPRILGTNWGLWGQKLGLVPGHVCGEPWRLFGYRYHSIITSSKRSRDEYF